MPLYSAAKTTKSTDRFFKRYLVLKEFTNITRKNIFIKKTSKLFNLYNTYFFIDFFRFPPGKYVFTEQFFSVLYALIFCNVCHVTSG